MRMSSFVSERNVRILAIVSVISGFCAGSLLISVPAQADTLSGGPAYVGESQASKKSQGYGDTDSSTQSETDAHTKSGGISVGETHAENPRKAGSAKEDLHKRAVPVNKNAESPNYDSNRHWGSSSWLGKQPEKPASTSKKSAATSGKTAVKKVNKAKVTDYKWKNGRVKSKTVHYH